MWQHLMKGALWAKSLASFGAAYEVAAAGRLMGGVCLGLIGLAPLAWKLTKSAVERPGELVFDDLSAARRIPRNE